MVKLTDVVYLPQAVKNIMSVSRIVSKWSTMGDTKDKTTMIFLTAWGVYTTSVNLTIFLPYSFIFTVPFISNLIFWTFQTVAYIFHSSMLVRKNFVYVMCNDALLSPKQFPRSSLLLISNTYPYNVELTKRFSTSSSLYFFFSQQ